jgi:hypothetical protein
MVLAGNCRRLSTASPASRQCYVANVGPQGDSCHTCSSSAIGARTAVFEVVGPTSGLRPLSQRQRYPPMHGDCRAPHDGWKARKRLWGAPEVDPTKIHLLADALGRPQRFALTGPRIVGWPVPSERVRVQASPTIHTGVPGESITTIAPIPPSCLAQHAKPAVRQVCPSTHTVASPLKFGCER